MLGAIVVQMVPAFRQMQECIDGINRVLREQITGLRVVRAFVREPEETARFKEANEELTATSLRGGRLMAMMFPTVNMLINVSSVAVLWLGAGPRQHRRPAGRLARRLPQLPHPDPDVGRDADVHAVDGPPRRRSPATASRRSSTRSPRSCHRPSRCRELAGHGRLELRGAGFHYPGAEQPVLNDISFTTTAGRTTAIIGSTGAGKTTLVGLVPRLFDATERVRCSSMASTCATSIPRSLWNRIGLVPQRPYLFSGTVASNLRFGKPDATEDEMWEALRRRPGRRLRAGHAGWPRGPHRAGRHQRLGRPAPAAVDRQGARAQDRRSTSSTTRSRPSTWPPTPACAWRCGRTPRNRPS